MDKSLFIQKQVKDNSEDLQSEYFDMKHWEEQMRRKDEELRKGSTGQSVLPPIRSKNKKKIQKPESKGEAKNTADPKRIKSYDYSSWDKFDVDKACKEVDKEEQSDDSEVETMSKEELEKSHDIATKHKNEGNTFVQQQKWDKAIACYSEAIKIFPYDAVFYANRALCQLKMDNLYSAEADCSTAIQLDEAYVKAYHRRATARIGLKQYKEAKQDVEKILKLEPSNKEAKLLFSQVEKKIQASKPVIISKEDVPEETEIERKIGEKLWSNNKTKAETKDLKKDEKGKDECVDLNRKKRDPRIPDWLPEKDDVAVVEPVIKPPHLRSKKPMTRIPVEDANFDTMRYTDYVNKTVTDKDQATEILKPSTTDTPKETSGFVKPVESLESLENIDETLEVPKTAVQFLRSWRRNKSLEFRYKYLKQLPRNSLSKIFQDSMESDVFSEILETLNKEFTKRDEPVFRYLYDLSQVKRFRTFIMFINSAEKEDLRRLFKYCESTEILSDGELSSLREKYEI